MSLLVRLEGRVTSALKLNACSTLQYRRRIKLRSEMVRLVLSDCSEMNRNSNLLGNWG